MIIVDIIKENFARYFIKFTVAILVLSLIVFIIYKLTNNFYKDYKQSENDKKEEENVKKETQILADDLIKILKTMESLNSVDNSKVDFDTNILPINIIKTDTNINPEFGNFINDKIENHNFIFQDYTRIKTILDTIDNDKNNIWWIFYDINKDFYGINFFFKTKQLSIASGQELFNFEEVNNDYKSIISKRRSPLLPIFYVQKAKMSNLLLESGSIIGDTDAHTDAHVVSFINENKSSNIKTGILSSALQSGKDFLTSTGTGLFAIGFACIGIYLGSTGVYAGANLVIPNIAVDVVEETVRRSVEQITVAEGLAFLGLTTVS